jgi:hypothetical protein
MKIQVVLILIFSGASIGLCLGVLGAETSQGRRAAVTITSAPSPLTEIHPTTVEFPKPPAPLVPGCDASAIVTLPTGERVLWMYVDKFKYQHGGGPAMCALLLPPLKVDPSPAIEGQ